MRREEIEDLKKINLISFLESLGFRPHWQSEERAMFLSPLREEANPSFYVQKASDGSWTWRDWGTGEGGDIIKFVQDFYGVDFKEALRRLGEVSLPALKSSCGSSGRKRPKTPSPKWVREFYGKEVIKMQGQKLAVVRRYFHDLGVRYYPEMMCIPVEDRKDGKLYVGIPIPYPLKMRGLELREIGGNAKKTWGQKTIWLLKRDSRRVLVTESILDALAGEIILGDDQITLCSLNGVGNVGLLDTLFSLYKPAEVVLALDNDEPGRIANRRAFEIAFGHKVRVVEFEGHLKAGAKDLHKLLRLRQEVNYERYDLSLVQRTPAFLS